MYSKGKPLQTLFSGYNDVGKASVVSPGAGQQLQVFNFKAGNRSGGAIDVGLLKKLDTSAWKFYTIVAASTPDAADVTTAVQAGTTTTVFTTTNNDGYMVGAIKPFGLIGLTVATAPAGGSPAYTYQYYNGTSFGTLTTIAVPSYGTGTNLVVFNPPIDWAVGTTAAVGPTGSSTYNILVRASTAPNATAGTISAAWVAQFLDFQGAVADKSFLERTYNFDRPLLLDGNESLMPYFSGSASASNFVEAVYAIQQ
jgi:hypothetical protein